MRKKRSEEARLLFEKKDGTTVVEMVKRSTIGECGTIVVAHLSFHAVFCSCSVVLFERIYFICGSVAIADASSEAMLALARMTRLDSLDSNAGYGSRGCVSMPMLLSR